MSDEKKKKNSAGSQARMGLGNLTKALEREDATPEEQEQIRGQLAELNARFGVTAPPQGEPVHQPAPEPGPLPPPDRSEPEPDRAPAPAPAGRRDLSRLRAELERNKALREKYVNQGHNVINGMIQVREIERAIELTYQAEQIAPGERRRYGCEKNSREQVTLDGYRPDHPIRFRHHVYETDDPMEIIYLEERMSRHAPGTAPIRRLREDEIAMVDYEYTGYFFGFEDEERAKERIQRRQALPADRLRA